MFLPPQKLEELPNIGKAIAADLRAIAITQPQQLAEREPLEVYLSLAKQMAHRHDPCVLYTLLAVRHFLHEGEKVAWWHFTKQGKKLLAAQQKSRP